MIEASIVKKEFNYQATKHSFTITDKVKVLERKNIMKKFIAFAENIDIIYSRQTIGGKAYGLWQLSKLGMNIPESGVIPSFMEFNDIIFDQVKNFADEVIYTYGAEEKFAVRSSGTIEDGDQASFAGMYKTLLNVSVDELYEAIQECYDSFHSNRVGSYKDALGIEKSAQARMSIVIQRMIQPTHSGVCFTINPINNNDKEMIVEITDGLGEKLVSGQVTPSYYLIQKDNGAVIEFEYGDNNSGKISTELVKDIWKKSMYISNGLKYPTDIEFCIKENELFLLQARKITTSNKREMAVIY